MDSAVITMKACFIACSTRVAIKTGGAGIVL